MSGEHAAFLFHLYGINVTDRMVDGRVVLTPEDQREVIAKMFRAERHGLTLTVDDRVDTLPEPIEDRWAVWLGGERSSR